MMASIRGVFRLASALRIAAIRQRTFSSVSRWRHLTAVSVPSWSTSHNNLQPHVTMKRPIVPTRWFASEGITLSELETRVIGVLQAFDKIDPEKVTKDAHFINDLGLDSLDVVEIVMAFEDEFGVEIDDEQAEKLFTAQDAIEFLKKGMDVH